MAEKIEPSVTEGTMLTEKALDEGPLPQKGNEDPNEICELHVDHHLTSEDFYYDRFARLGFHEEMLKDNVRTLTYQNALYYNKHLFRGKVVLDVGCGTGILSLFAAKAEATRVIAIECSGINYAEEIIKENKLSHIVSVVKGAVGEVTLPDGIDQVDIIVSEWLGFCLFYESRLDNVLLARDRWLKPDGLMFPDRATLFICSIEDRMYKSEKFNWWNNVYGFNLGSIGKAAIYEPMVDIVAPKQVITNSCFLKELDLYTVKHAELSFRAPFVLRVKRDTSFTAFLTFCNIEFTRCHTRMGFSTAPEAPLTHWKQTIFYFEEDLFVKEGEEISGFFSVKPNAGNKRELDFVIDLVFHGDVSQLCDRFKYHMRY